MVDILIRDKLRLSVEAASNGKQTVVYTAKGQPSFMTVIPKFDMASYGAKVGLSGTHRAFRKEWGVEFDTILIGTYHGSIKDGELLSQPYTDPIAGGYQTTRELMRLAANCGPGFHLVNQLEWNAATVHGRMNGGKYLGNQEGGRDITGHAGVVVAGSAYQTYAGSGGAAWTHDGSPTGIHDMTGGVWQRVTGIRNCFGELQVSVNNNMFNIPANTDIFTDFEIGSWAAIDAVTGELITPTWTGKLEDKTYRPTTPRSIRLSTVLGDTSDYTLSCPPWETFQTAKFSLGGTNKISEEGVRVLREYGVYPIDGFSADLNTFCLYQEVKPSTEMTEQYTPIHSGLPMRTSSGPYLTGFVVQPQITASDVYCGRPAYQPKY